MEVERTITPRGKAGPRIAIEQLRRELPLTREVAYFQTGSWGPTLDSVLRTMFETMEFESHLGPGNPRAREALLEREQDARERLASFLSVKTTELGFTPNTSQAIERVFRSIPWREKDEIVLSSLEHVSTIATCQALLENRVNVVIKVVGASEGDSGFLEELDSAINERTKLVCVSHVTSSDGRRLPVEDAVKVARGKGVPIVIDGAQAVGQFPVDVSALGCDFYAGAGHKWLLGPMGLGFLWVASNRLPKFKPDLLPDHHPWEPRDLPSPPITTSTRIEGIETRNLALPIALAHAVEIISSIGLEEIETYVARLSAILRSEVAQWKKTTLLTPAETVGSSGITTLAFDGYGEADMRRLVTRLYEEDGIVVKFQWLTAPARPELTAMRISIAVFNTEHEVRHLLEVLKRELHH